MATDDLKARMADVATFGYMPAAARLALQQGVKRIEALEAQLAAAEGVLAGIAEATDLYEPCGWAVMRARDYAKGQTDAQQGD